MPPGEADFSGTVGFFGLDGLITLNRVATTKQILDYWLKKTGDKEKGITVTLNWLDSASYHLF